MLSTDWFTYDVAEAMLTVERPQRHQPFLRTAQPAARVHDQKEMIFILLPNNQRQHRTLHIPKDVLPCAIC